MTDMRQKLEELGLREEYDEPRTLSSGLKSRVFWDVERLYKQKGHNGCGFWKRLETLAPWIVQIEECQPKSVMGIPTGGKLLATDVTWRLNVTNLKCPSLRWQHVSQSPSWSFLNEHIRALRKRYPCVLIDDVLTTGGTVSHLLRRFSKEWNGRVYSPFVAIAVLVNRSGLDEIEGIPVISGVKADPVEQEGR